MFNAFLYKLTKTWHFPLFDAKSFFCVGRKKKSPISNKRQEICHAGEFLSEIKILIEISCLKIYVH